MTQRDRMIAILTAGGFTAAEVGRRLRVSTRTVEGVRAKPPVKALIREYERSGVGPVERLTILTYSADEQVALRASVELAKLQPSGGSPDGDPDYDRIEVIHDLQPGERPYAVLQVHRLPA